jgi:hypothetical protein
LKEIKVKKPVFNVDHSQTHSVSDSVEIAKEKQNSKVLDLLHNQSKIIGKRKRFVNPLQLEKKLEPE